MSALFLWEREDRSPLAGRRVERFRASASFFLEVGAALLLALAFAGFRGCGGGEATHLVVVLDASASMGARAPDGALRERALRFVEDRVRALARGSRVTVLRSGTPTTLLAGPAAYPVEALERLAAYEPLLPHHDLAAAVALGQQLSGAGSVLLVTDRYEPDAFPAEVEVVSVGEPAANVGFAHAARFRRRDPGDPDVAERVFLAVANFSGGEARRRLSLGTPERDLEERDLVLAAGERRHLSFDLPEGTPTIEARLSEDALAIDDRAVLAPTPPRTLALASSLSREEAIALGLGSGAESASSIDRFLALVPESVEIADADRAHLVLGRGTVGAPRAWRLSIESPGAERKDLIGPFLAEKRHPLLEGVTLEGIVWSADPDLALPGAPLVSAGNEPLLVETREGEALVFRMNLDPARSTLQRSPDWPILLSNLAEMRRARLPGPERTNLFVGETFVYRDAGPGEWVFEGEGERRELRSSGTLVVDGIGRPGLYALAKDGESMCEVGVTFADAAESDLRGLRPGRRETSVALAGVRAEFAPSEIALLAAALLFVLLDWFVLRRAGGGPG